MSTNKPDSGCLKRYKAGDVVRLKSGGPKMTVTQYGDDGFGVMTVWAIWFDEAKRIDGNFPADAVEAVEAV